MNFEDIVDMDWVDSNTTLESTDFCLDQPDFLLEQPATPPSQPQPEIKMEPTTNITFDQIKQLIEIAKHQLALRENSTGQQQPLFQALSPQHDEVKTAAPSKIFAPPPSAISPTSPAMPALSPSTITSTDMTLAPPMSADDLLKGLRKEEDREVVDNAIKQEETETASLLPSLRTEATPSPPPSSASTATASSGSNDKKSKKKRKENIFALTDETISIEAYAQADGIDLNDLTTLERRQLRNKISARNFRVRRKEYITTLEGQVNDHKKAAEQLKEKLTAAELENTMLRSEMDILKIQNQILLQQQQQYQEQQQQQKEQEQKNPASPRISSPLPKPNLNKDISILGTKASDSYRQDNNCILVSNAVMPAWDYNAILSTKEQQPTQTMVPDYIKNFAGQLLFSVVQLARTMPRGTNQGKENDGYNRPLMPDDRDFTSSTNASSIKSYLNASPSYHTSSMEDLYDFLIQSALINSSTTDKSFWWWDTTTTI